MGKILRSDYCLKAERILRNYVTCAPIRLLINLLFVELLDDVFLERLGKQLKADGSQDYHENAE